MKLSQTSILTCYTFHYLLEIYRWTALLESGAVIIISFDEEDQ